MSTRHPRKEAWEREEEMLLGDTGAFSKKHDEEVIDEDALLSLDTDDAFLHEHSADQAVIQLDDSAAFDITAESQQDLDYEDLPQDDAEGDYGHNEGEEEEEQVELEAAEEEEDALIVNDEPNTTTATMKRVKPEVFGGGDNESESDSDEEKKDRGRFKSERHMDSIKVSKASDIPENLEVTEEMQHEIEMFEKQKQKQQQNKRGKNQQRRQQHQQQQQHNMNQHMQQQQHGQFRMLHPRFNGPVGQRPQRFQGQRGQLFQGQRGQGPRAQHIPTMNSRPAFSGGPHSHGNTGMRPLMSAGSMGSPRMPYPHEMVRSSNPHSTSIPPGSQGLLSVPSHMHNTGGPQPLMSHAGTYPSQSQSIHVNPNFQGPLPHNVQTQQPRPQHHVQQPQHFSLQGPPGNANHVPASYPQQGLLHSPSPLMNHQGPHPGPQMGLMDQPRPNYNQPMVHNVNHQPSPRQQSFPQQRPPNSYPGPHHQSHQGQPVHQGPRPGLTDQFRPNNPGPHTNQAGPRHPGHGQGPQFRSPNQQAQPPGPRHPGPNQSQFRPNNPQHRPQNFQNQNRGPQPRHPNHQQQQQQQHHQQQQKNQQQQGSFNPQQNNSVEMEDPAEAAARALKEKELEEKKKKRQARFSSATPVATSGTVSVKKIVANTGNSNIKVLTGAGSQFSTNITSRVGTKVATKVAAKRPSGDSIQTDISPSKIIKLEPTQVPNDEKALQAALEKQKQMRERVRQMKEARRLAEANKKAAAASEAAKVSQQGNSNQGQQQQNQQQFQQQQQFQHHQQPQQQSGPNQQNRQFSQGQGSARGQFSNRGQARGRGRGYNQQGQSHQEFQQHYIEMEGQPISVVGQVSQVNSQQQQGRGGIRGQGGARGQGQRGRGQRRDGVNIQVMSQLQEVKLQPMEEDEYGGEYQASPNRMVMPASVGVVRQVSTGMTGFGDAGQNTTPALNRTVIARTTSGHPDGSHARTVLATSDASRRFVLDGAGDTESCCVSIDGLSKNADLGKINSVCSTCGEVLAFDYRPAEKRVMVRFANQAQATNFIKKHNRFMVDMTFLNSRRIPDF